MTETRYHSVEDDHVSESGSGIVLLMDKPGKNPDEEQDDVSGFVQLLKSGWVSVTEKNGDQASYPPHRVDVVLWTD